MAGTASILSILPAHEKPALVFYISLILDPTGPVCTGENEADVVEPGDKSSRQHLSTGGCTEYIGLEQSTCAEQPQSVHAVLARLVARGGR